MAVKVGKHCSHHFRKKNQSKKSSGQCAGRRKPVTLLEFRSVPEQGFDVRSTTLMCWAWGLHSWLLSYTLLLMYLQCRAAASAPCQDSVGQMQLDLLSRHLALPAWGLRREAVGLRCSYPLFIQGTFPSSSFAPWTKPSPSASCQVATCS